MDTQAKAQPTVLAGMYKIPIPTPFKVGAVNAYLLEGDALTLIDCGPRTTEAYEFLAAAIGEVGYRMADIEQLIISHHHIDHLGLAARIVAESGARVVCHPYCAPYLQDQTATFEHYVAFTSTIYREAGVPQAVIDTLQDAKTWYDKYGSPHVSVAATLAEGDTIRLAGHTWQVYHTPGHAGDLICLYAPATQVLLAFDHLIAKISSNPLIEPSPTGGDTRPHRLVEYITHLERMAQLPIQVAYSGHGGEIYDVPSLVAKRVGFHHERAAHILGLFEGQAQTLWQMTQKMFSHVGPGDRFLALSEVLGHIDLLEEAGQLSRHRDNDVVYWRPTV